MEGEKPTNQASVKSLVVPVLPPSGSFRLEAAMRGAVLHHFFEHRGHDAGGARGDYIFHIREVLLEHAAIVVGHFGDVARSEADSIVGKYAEGGGLLDQSDFGGAECDREIRRDVRRDAEAMSIVDDSLDAESLGELAGRECCGTGRGLDADVMTPSNFSS